MISCYAPTNATSIRDESIREEFYDTVEAELARVANRTITLVGGDWNAKPVGRVSVEELWTSLKNTIHEVAMETIGQRPATPRGHIYASEQVKLLSEHQHLLKDRHSGST